MEQQVRPEERAAKQAATSNAQTHHQQQEEQEDVPDLTMDSAPETRWQRLIAQRPTLFARCLFLITCCICTNLILWIATLITAPPSSSSFCSLALVGWTTGLRHGLDADHIAAIDNATRRLVAVPLDSNAKLTIREKLFWWKKSGGGGVPRDVQDITLSQRSGYRRPTTVGLWFSLGHSTIVVAVTLAVAISISVAGKLGGVGDVGGIIGQSVSGSFLFLVAVINSVILFKTVRARKADKKKRSREQQQQHHHKSSEIASGVHAVTPNVDKSQAITPDVEKSHSYSVTPDVEKGNTPTSIESNANPSNSTSTQHRFTGLLTRLTSPLLKAVTRPWHMYFVGVAFGIGFDTASTIALLSIAAAAGRSSSSDINESDAANYSGGNAKVILLAFLFTAGMTLVDSLDSVLMIHAYAPEVGEKGNKWWALWERPQEMAKVETTLDTDTTSPHVAQTLSNSAQHLSLLLTLLSILMAFAISLIVIMALLAGNCKACSRSLELHNEPIVDAQGHVLNDGGLAGRWWNFWDQAGEQSGYIGAGLVAFFALFVALWWGGKWVRRRWARPE